MDCLICAKHRGEGTLVGPIAWEDEHCVAYHAPFREDGKAFLGYLFLETRRHVPYLADLNDAEAATIGRVASRLAHGLRTELNADFVFSAIIGTGVAHFHQHLFARHPGTPAEYRWMAGDEWPGAPRGTEQEITELCGRLRTYVEQP